MLTVKNENYELSGPEKILRDKMNELSASVDCFDKISARAFPEKDPDFSEGGFTVNSVENITGRSRKPGILKWAALAAAAVICIAIIPLTGLPQHIRSNLSGSSTPEFRQILEEIETETEQNEYRIFDVSLDYYLKNDVLVTPLFSCPFEDCRKDDANVRIYIKCRTFGSGIVSFHDTLQVYAVEYTGEYSESGIIAAAKSAYTFTNEDWERVTFPPDITDTNKQLVDSAVALNFAPDADGIYLRNTDGEPVSVACQNYGCFISSSEGIDYCYTSILYGHTGAEGSDGYFYDTVTTTAGGELTEMPDRREMWARSVYFNGNSAFPKTDDGSGFTHTELFTANGELHFPERSYSAISLMEKNGAISLTPARELSLINSETHQPVCTINAPADPNALNEWYAFYTMPSSQDNSVHSPYTLNVIYNGEFLCELTHESFGKHRSLTAEEQAALENERLAIEEDNRRLEAEYAAEQEAALRKESIRTRIAEYEAERSRLRDEIGTASDSYDIAEIQARIDVYAAEIESLNKQLEESSKSVDPQ